MENVSMLLQFYGYCDKINAVKILHIVATVYKII